MQPAVPDLFAPFGALIEAPTVAGERRMYSEWLAPVAGRSLQFHTNHVRPSAAPLSLTQVERHPHAAQVFLPLTARPYVVTVMTSDAHGQPDPASARALLVPPTTGVVYRPGTWHAGITALDEVASFAVLMWRNGIDDDEFVRIPPVEIWAAVAFGGGHA